MGPPERWCSTSSLNDDRREAVEIGKAARGPELPLTWCLDLEIGTREDARRHMPSSPPRASQQVTKSPPCEAMRVLLVLDQPMVVRLAMLTLKHGGYDTRAATSGAEAVSALVAWQPHLVLLDMDLDGSMILDQVGARGAAGGRLPVIALTRRGDLRTKLAAFEAGVDDILTIPFSPEELLARVTALLRRSYSDAVTFTPAIKLGELELDILDRIVRAGTSEFHLTSLEQSLLYLLAANAGRVVTREEIVDSLWGPDYVIESQVVDRHIRNLRALLQDDWKRPRFIFTVRGRGYRFLPTFTSPSERARR